MSDPNSSYRVTIAIAVIGVVGTLGAALIGNWDKIFPQPDRRATRSSTAPKTGPTPVTTETQAPPTVDTTTVLRSAKDEVRQYKLVSEGPGLVVFEVDYAYDPAHRRPMYMRVIIYSEAEGETVGRKPRRKVIANGVSEALGPTSGTVRIDARKLLAQPAMSSFVEVALQEEAVPVAVKQFPLRRQWGPA